MKILQKAKKYSVQIIIIAFLILVQCVFISQKEGYHMDELLSFELANAEYNPWIVPTQPVGRLAKFMQEEIDADTLSATVGNLKDVIVDVLQNKGNSKLLTYKADVYEEPVWITGEQFHDYVTTGEGDRFNYLSVYFNVKDDNHPPIHFMLLHTVSSLFPGKVAPMMGCIINILAVVGCAVIFMRLGFLLDAYEITKNRFGLVCGSVMALMYGCSQAATATTLLIRMYGVMTFLCMCTFYIHIRKWLQKGFDRKNGLLIAVTVLGFLTQYFFLFYCMLLSLVTAVLLFVYRRRREAWIYIRTMVIAAVIGVGVFPFSVGDVFQSGRGVEALDNLAGGLGDYLERIARFGEILLQRCFGNVWIGLILLLLSLVFGAWITLKYKKYAALSACFYLPVMGYFFLAAKMSPMYVDRYLMACFPFVVAWFAFMVCFLVSRLPRLKICVLIAVTAVFGAVSIFAYDGSYLYTGYEEQLEIAEEYSHLSCICLYEGSGYYDNLLEFAEYERTLLVTPQELAGRKDRSDMDALDEVIIVKKAIVTEETLQTILKQYGFDSCQVLLRDGACGDTVYLCRRQ